MRKAGVEQFKSVWQEMESEVRSRERVFGDHSAQRGD
jgi:hypothetical protein